MRNPCYRLLFSLGCRCLTLSVNNFGIAIKIQRPLLPLVLPLVLLIQLVDAQCW